MNTEHAIAKKILIEADAATVWQVLTDAAYIVDWLGVHVLSDWNVGSPLVFLFDGSGRPFSDKSTILKLDSEKMFSYSFWSEVSGLPDRPENYSVIAFWLINKGEATALILNHDHLPMKTMVEHVAKHWEQTLMTIKGLAEGKRARALRKGPARVQKSNTPHQQSGEQFHA
jgi:uncharacterized protein YndB with AHSA1/START domain